MDLTRDFFIELQQAAVRAARQASYAFFQLSESLKPALASLYEFAISFAADKHKDESIEHYLERRERKERARKRYLRRAARR